MSNPDTAAARLAAIGARIALARKAAGLSTRAALAEAIETSYTQVRRWEVGSHEIGLLWVERVARACSVSVDWLLTGEGDGPTEASATVERQATGTEGA